MKRMNVQDKKAKEEGTLLGRILREPYADGYAYYEIVKLNKATIVLRHLDISDGYYANHWGDETVLYRAWIKELLEAKDSLDDLLMSSKALS